MRSENDVEAFDAGGKLAVGVETVLRQQDHERDALTARPFDCPADFLLVRSESPGRQYRARMQRGRMRISVTQHRDPHAAFFDYSVGCKDALLFGVAHIEREEGIA